MKVILREGQQIGPNKNIEEWQIEGCHYTGDNVTALRQKYQTVTALSPKQGHTKRNYYKRKKEIIKHYVRKCSDGGENHLTVTKKPTRHSRKYSGAGMRKAGKKTQLQHSEHSSGNGVNYKGTAKASLPRCWQKTSHAGMVSSSIRQVVTIELPERSALERRKPETIQPQSKTIIRNHRIENWLRVFSTGEP